MFQLLGRFAVTHPWRICAAWIVAGALLSWLSPAWNTKAQDDDIHFLPQRCPSVRGYQLLRQAFPQDVFASRLIFAVERPDRALDDADYALVEHCVTDLQRLRAEQPELQIGKIVCCHDGLIGSRLTSADRQCMLIELSLGTPFLALQTRTAVDRAEAAVRQRLAEVPGDPPQLLATGPAGIGRDLTRASGSSLDSTTLATVGLVVVVLLLVYRAPLLALVPLLTIAVSVWVSLQALALLTLIPGVYLVNVSKVFAIVILYGAGTDYCLFLISRYCEELEKGQSGPNALSRSVRFVGGALAASAGTVICGLGMMGLAEFAKVRCAGPAIGLSLTVALLASLTLAPALLRLLGWAAFWPRSVPVKVPAPRLARHEPDSDSARAVGWDWISRSVVARPALVWGLAVLLLGPLAFLGLQVTPIYKATGELHPLSDSVQGLAVIQQHFTAGEVGPVTVLLTSDKDWNTPSGRALVSHLSRGFALLDNVAEVRSLTQPLGTPLPEIEPIQQSKGLLSGLFHSLHHEIATGAIEQGQRAAREFYLAELPDHPDGRYVTRLDVVLRTDPFDTASIGTLELLETWLDEQLPLSAHDFGDVHAECYGVTVNARDLAEITESDRTRVNMLVLSGIFFILLVLVRRPWLASYLLFTVLLSYYATLGATTLMGTLWSGRPIGQVDWRVPFFLFTILVAVGEDYNILLITRVLQERQQHGADEGIRRALARTGGTITSCGLIMAGTFATLMLAGLGTLVQIGFALAFGVLLDTFVVRPFLVPAFALLVWRARPPATTEPALLPAIRRAA
jgi:RND superfamily putative drug exporter